MNEFELIICIVNKGYSDTVMDAARSNGAGGGTIVNARGTANPESEKLFGVVVQPEKETVLIVAKKEKVDAIVSAIYDVANLATDGHGIAFTLPIDSIVGLPEKQLTCNY